MRRGDTPTWKTVPGVIKSASERPSIGAPKRANAARTITRVGGVEISVIGRIELIRNKKAMGRAKDLADAAWLEGREV